MQIALVADHLSLPGALSACAYPDDDSVAVLCLAQALAAAGQDVTIYARNDSPDTPANSAPRDGVTVQYVDAGPAASLSDDKLLPHIPAFAGQLAEHWRRATPAVVHGFSWSSGMVALAGARDLDIRVVQTHHSYPSPEAAARGRWPRGRVATARARLEAAADRTADAVLAPHSAAVTELARIGVPRTAIRLVPGGVDTGSFRPEGDAVRRGEFPRLLMITSMADAAEQEIALHTLAYLPGMELVLAGGSAGEPGRVPAGRAQDRDEPAQGGAPGQEPAARTGGPPRDKISKAIAKLARQLGVLERVTFAGPLTRAMAPPLMRSAGLVMNLAATAPWDAVALDAMACGVPVLVGASPLHEDVVIDGVTGFLVPSASPRLLADRARGLLASPMQRDGYRIAAASRARERYDWNRIGQETLAVYTSLDPRGADAAA